jgi:O-acetylhomoserine (thiol)-lyase
MKSETVAVHGGYQTDPTTKAVAVPIYQTVAYEFDSADHGAALFNLEAEGFRYSRISNPTTAVLERRVAELEGGVEALCVSSGQAALNYAVLNLTAMGTNIVSVPQLYGTTYTLFSHVLPSQGIHVRFAESDSAAAIEKLIDDKTRAIFCESVGNPAGRSRGASWHSTGRRQHRGDPDSASPDRLRRRHRGALADQIHGRPWHHARRRHCRQR